MPTQPGIRDQRAPRIFVWRLAALALVLAWGSIGYARALMHPEHQAHALNDPKALGLFPKQIGSYTLRREWNEYLVAGPLIFYWADYAPADGGPIVSVGISPVLGAHDTLLCHAARGEDWLWHGDLDLPTTTGPTTFSSSFFNDGATQYLEATTLCTGSVCGQFSSPNKHFGLIYSKPDTHTLLTQSPSRPIPILLRTETLDTALAADTARAQLTENLQHFLANARLDDFTQPYR